MSTSRPLSRWIAIAIVTLALMGSTLLIGAAPALAQSMTVTVASLGSRTEAGELNNLELYNPTTMAGSPIGSSECTSTGMIEFRLDNVPAGSGPIEIWTGSACNTGTSRRGTTATCFLSAVGLAREGTTFNAQVLIDELWQLADEGGTPSVSGCDDISGGTEQREFFFLPLSASESAEDVAEGAFDSIVIGVDLQPPGAPSFDSTSLSAGADSTTEVSWDGSTGESYEITYIGGLDSCDESVDPVALGGTTATSDSTSFSVPTSGSAAGQYVAVRVRATDSASNVGDYSTTLCISIVPTRTAGDAICDQPEHMNTDFCQGGGCSIHPASPHASLWLLGLGLSAMLLVLRRRR